MLKGIYVGARDDLTGEHALILRQPCGGFMAQFNNTELAESFGWHEFNECDFVLLYES